MKQKLVISILIAVVGVILLSVMFTGCISNNTNNNVADVRLEGFSHHEVFELPSQYISVLSFTLQNKGKAIADNIKLHIEIEDNDGNEVYYKDITLNYPLNPNEEKVQSIDVPYNLDDIQLDMDISVSWNGGTNNYVRSYEPEYKEYADVILESMTHHESYDLSNGYIASVDFLIQNRGNLIADNVKIHVIVHDNAGNEEYNKEENVLPLLLPWEVNTYKIKVPYDFDDIQLNFSIFITWDGGVTHYNRSFEPEFKEYADVKLERMTHFEQYKLYSGYVSTVTFILQNKGNAPADNVKLHIIAYNNDGNEVYNSDINVVSSLIPGDIKSQEITIPYEFDETQLDLSIIVSWDGGSNNYSESFEPRIFV